MRALMNLAACASIIIIAGCRTAGVSPERIERLDALLTNLHQRGLFDGAVVIGDGERIVYERGFGLANVEKNVAFTPDTVADGASLAKTFTAALVLMLDREGVVRLDDPVQKYLAEFPYPNITLRHLLSHSSGLPVLDYDWFDTFVPRDTVRTTDVLLRALAEHRPALLFAPGTAFEYSSFGYDLAALAASRASAKTYATLLDERIFRPRGITTAFVRPGRLADFPSVRTLAYKRVGGRLVVNDVFDMEAFAGGSNVYISARDLHRWNASFFPGPPFDVQALAPARLAGVPAALSLANWYHSSDGRAFWYSGHLQGFHSEVYRDVKKRRSIVYMSNNTMEAWLQPALIRAINATLDGATGAPLGAPIRDPIGQGDYPRIAGSWLMNDGEHLSTHNTANGRFIEVRGVRYRMVHVDATTFYTPGLDWMISFTAERIHVSSKESERTGVPTP